MGGSRFSWAAREVARRKAGRSRARGEEVGVCINMILSLKNRRFKTVRLRSDFHHRNPLPAGPFPSIEPNHGHMIPGVAEPPGGGADM